MCIHVHVHVFGGIHVCLSVGDMYVQWVCINGSPTLSKVSRGNYNDIIFLLAQCTFL